MLIFYHDIMLVLQEYWVLTESRIPLKPGLGGVIIVHFPLFLMNRLNKIESSYIVGSEGSVFSDLFTSNTCGLRRFYLDGSVTFCLCMNLAFALLWQPYLVLFYFLKHIYFSL